MQQKFLDEFRRQVVLGAKSQTTLRTYEVVLDAFGRGSRVEHLEEVDQDVVGKYLVDLREGRLPFSRKPNSPATVAKNWRHLNGFFQWCRRRGYRMHHSLFEEGRRGATILTIPQPIVDEGEPKAWSEGEIASIRQAARNSGHNAAERAFVMLIVELLLRTGVRLSELVNIKLDDIQGENIRVTKSKAVRGRRIRPMRWVPLYPEPRSMVAKWIEKFRPDAPTEHLLISPATGTAITMRGVQSMLQRIEKMVGCGSSAHRYRHAFGIFYLRKNPGQIAKLKEIMGHSDFQTVMIYAKFAQQDITVDSEDPFA